MDSIPQQLLLQVILILINAFFAMTEIAVISLNAGRLRMLAEEGDKTAPKLLKLVEEPSKLRWDVLEQTKRLCQANPELFFCPKTWEECESLLSRLVVEQAAPGAAMAY